MLGVIDMSDMMVLLENESISNERRCRARPTRASRNCQDRGSTEPIVKAVARVAGRSAAKSLDDGEASPTIPSVMPGADLQPPANDLDARRPRDVP
jgi:hypothetical protein